MGAPANEYGKRIGAHPISQKKILQNMLDDTKGQSWSRGIS